MIAWVDTETTGLDPHRGTHQILELGIILTDDQLLRCATFRHVLWFPTSRHCLLDDFVLNMHTENSLLAECSKAGTNWTHQFVAQRAIRFIDEHCGEEKPIVAGSTIEFDRIWMQAFMPDLSERFYYRSINVSSFHEAAARWAPKIAEQAPAKRNKHRVIPDAEDSIALGKFYKRMLFEEIS